ncbi:MAG: helix-turn-helix transcriptional regulator [Pseudonocardiales bacterium]|nr:helix-turn-helix transcriptional regulator [Pseudonocardiales bacterium]
MEPVQLWTGRTACALQAALRMTNESFAAHLGTAVRTVATWHQKPDRVPSSEMQQALDTTLERAGEGAQARFARNVADMGASLESTSPSSAGPIHAAADETAIAVDDLTAGASSAIMAGTAEDTADGGFMGWLQVAHAASAPPDGSDVGQIIRWYRMYEGLTQQDAAVVLNTTQSRLSKLEKGTQALRDVRELRHIAKKLGIAPERLGVLRDQSADARPFASHVSDRPGPVRDSQEHWRAIRCQLNAHRAVLGELAAELYPAQLRIPGTTVLTSASWLSDGPVDLADIELAWRAESPIPQLGGKAPQSAGARPLMASGERYDRYSRALRDLARPKLLDNRVSYRLLDVEWSGSRGILGFNYTSYFDVLDVCEALGHEFTQAWLAAGRRRPSFAELPFRRSIVDSFDLWARPILPSINTLTIRRDCIEGHRMYLHRRDAKSVAVAGGMYHVVPAGVFQPAALAPAHQANDFSLWRNIQREFSEEFLGNGEHDGNSADPIAYDTDEPFASFERARQAGDFRVFACAMVLEPLTLWVELLTVAVIAAPVFDALFSEMVAVNEEGAAVSTKAGHPTVGIPFTAEARERLRTEPLSPISRACIELAWRYRHQLLGS